MSSKILYVVRGLPGSGKTTLAEALAPIHNWCTDMFFTDDDGNYEYDLDRVKEAHQWCQDAVRDSLAAGIDQVVVHNTFSEFWEAAPYFEIAAEFRYSVFVVEAQNQFGSIHGVPADIMTKMAYRWAPLHEPREKYVGEIMGKMKRGSIDIENLVSYLRGLVMNLEVLTDQIRGR